VELDMDDAMENVEGDAEKGGNTADLVTTAEDILTTTSIDFDAAGPLNVNVAGPSTKEPRRSTAAQPSSKDKSKAIMQEPKKSPKNPRKAHIQMDEELAQRLFE
ncbi:hypothetical protein Tco_0416371, partial [Tanacetum coccineum]